MQSSQVIPNNKPNPKPNPNPKTEVTNTHVVAYGVHHNTEHLIEFTIPKLKSQTQST